MKALTIALLSAGLVLGPVGVSDGGEVESSRLAGTITLSGAWALYPMAVRWAEEFQKLHPEVHLDIGAGGAGKGMVDALAHAVDLGMVSRDIYPIEIERGAWWVPVTRDAVVPVINTENPVIEVLLREGVSRDTLRKLWFGESRKTWGDVAGTDVRHPVRVYTRSDACGAAKTWAAYLGGTQEDLWGVGVYGDPGLADAVKRDALGIGFNNINFVYDASSKLPVEGLTVLPIDLDADGAIGEDEDFYADRDAVVAAIASGSYPSPPARDLYFVSQGEPGNRVVREFLRWVLTEGQQYVDEAGYIKLTDEKLSEGLVKLGYAQP